MSTWMYDKDAQVLYDPEESLEQVRFIRKVKGQDAEEIITHQKMAS